MQLFGDTETGLMRSIYLLYRDALQLLFYYLCVNIRVVRAQHYLNASTAIKHTYALLKLKRV